MGSSEAQRNCNICEFDVKFQEQGLHLCLLCFKYYKKKTLFFVLNFAEKFTAS